MNKNLEKLIRAKEAKKQELAERSKQVEKIEELRSINAEIDAINADLTELRQMAEDESQEGKTEGVAARTKAVNDIEDGQGPEVRGKKIVDPESGFVSRGKVTLDGTMQEKESVEARNREYGKNLKEGRSVTVGAGMIVLPKHTSDKINPSFLQSSNLIDIVKQVPIAGGESYSQPYEISTDDAAYTEEGAEAGTAEVKFGHADISKAKITAYSEMTEEVEKLAEASYAENVLAAVTTSMRKKIAKEIMVGAGTANSLTGIFSAKAAAISADTDLTIAKIDNTTLDSIIYGYGGDEAVEGTNVLILNKKDLAAFAKLRNNNGSKFHTIVMSGNGGSGTIDSIPFVINSACGSIADSKTAADTYCMAYGNPMNYQMTIFSEPEIRKSTEYKFKEGMICHRGVVFVGGNVVSQNGFIRVKKATQA